MREVQFAHACSSRSTNGLPVNRWKEIAKFVCGAEAFHAFVHAYLWFSGTNLTVYGFTLTPTWNLVSAVVNAVISLGLGLYAWRDTTPKQA